MLFTPKLSESGLTFISPIEWYSGVTGATFHENLTNYNNTKHDLYTFNYGYNSTLYSSFFPSGAPATVPGGTYYTPSGWNENNYLIKEFGKTPFTPYSVNTAYFFQYGPEYNLGYVAYCQDDVGLFTASVRNIAPMRLSPGVPGIGPRWSLLTRDVVVTMAHFQGNNPNPNTQINFIGTDNVVRGYTLAKVPNGTTAAFTQFGDLLICKLSQPVHETIKPVVFLNNITDNDVRYLNQLAITNLPLLVINRCRNIGYTNRRYISSFFPIENMDQTVGYAGGNPGLTYYNPVNFFSANSYPQYLDADLIDKETEIATQAFISLYSIIKENTDIPAGYFANCKYKNMLIDIPINNGDSTSPMFFIVYDDSGNARSALVSLYGSESSALNLYSEFGNLLENTYLPSIGAIYNKVEKINKKIVNKNIDIFNFRLKRAFSVDDNLLFYCVPKSLDSDEITINYVNTMNLKLSSIYGLPPFYYPDSTDRVNSGHTMSAIYSQNELISGSYGLNTGGVTLNDYIKEKFNKVKPNLESNFSFSNQKTLQLEKNKKYLMCFNAGNQWNRPDITERGITYIKYDDYSSWISYVLLGEFPPGITHEIVYNNTKPIQKIKPANYYLSNKIDSFSENNLIYNSIKKLSLNNNFPYNINNITNLEELSDIFEVNYTNHPQLIGITSNGYPLSLFNFTHVSTSIGSGIAVPTLRELADKYLPSNINNSLKQLYTLDTSELQNTIYLHAVIDGEIKATLPIQIISNNIQNNKILSKTSIKINYTQPYRELSNIQESHYQYLGAQLPANITPAGITYIWDKVLQESIPPEYITNNLNYKINVDNQNITPIVSTIATKKGITLASINIVP